VSISVTCECGRHFETPEAYAGRRAMCPVCRRELIIPKPAPPEVLIIREEPEPTVTSGKAIASLILGVLFFFACLSGVPAILLGRQALSDIKLSGGRLRGRGMAIAGIVLGLIGCLITLGLFMPAIRSARGAARRAQCTNNLKQIGLALHNYHWVYGCLPPAAITDKNGRPLLSWRVILIPYLEASPLYSKFHLDEPWDSPHNLSLLDRMPSVYACPGDSTLKPGMTGYQAVIGPDTAFTPDFNPLRFEDFTDGLSNTLIIGESRRAVPWTKPEDLPFDTALPRIGLGSHHGYHNNGFNASFADGSVRFLNSSITPSVLRALLTRNGNEVVSQESY
jgi:prepilin-type processing-associated H-X9-DG protein